MLVVHSRRKSLAGSPSRWGGAPPGLGRSRSTRFAIVVVWLKLRRSRRISLPITSRIFFTAAPGASVPNFVSRAAARGWQSGRLIATHVCPYCPPEPRYFAELRDINTPATSK
jgi:hypothetical protein